MKRFLAFAGVFVVGFLIGGGLFGAAGQKRGFLLGRMEGEHAVKMSAVKAGVGTVRKVPGGESVWVWVTPRD